MHDIHTTAIANIQNMPFFNTDFYHFILLYTDPQILPFSTEPGPAEGLSNVTERMKKLGIEKQGDKNVDYEGLASLLQDDVKLELLQSDDESEDSLSDETFPDLTLDDCDGLLKRAKSKERVNREKKDKISAEAQGK